MDYIISHSRLTTTSVLIYTGYEDSGAILPFTIYASDGTTVVESISANDPRWNAVEISSILITGLTPSTTYIAKLDQSPSTSTTFTTLDDPAKTATESQWQDLANRVKAKQEETTISNNTLYL